MKVIRIFSRLLLLLLVAAAFVGLTAIYGSSTHPALPNVRYQQEQRHEPSAPEIGYFSQFVGYGIMLAVFCYAGRMLFRLRLNPAPHGEGQPIVLGLRENTRRT